MIDKTSRTWANTVHTHLLAVQRQLPMREPGEPAPYGVPNNAPPSLRSSRNTDLVTTSESKCPVADPMWLSVSFSCMYVIIKIKGKVGHDRVTFVIFRPPATRTSSSNVYKTSSPIRGLRLWSPGLYMMRLPEEHSDVVQLISCD